MKRTFQSAILFAISGLLFSACNAPAGETKAMDMDKTKAEIQGMENAFAAAEKAKDVNAVAAYYSPDAISYGRNEEPSSGIAAIKEHIARSIAKDTAGNANVYKVVDLFGDEKLLVEIGSWTVLDPAGKETDKGHYMSCFQKRDGKYMCIRDMNVTSTPIKKPM